MAAASVRRLSRVPSLLLPCVFALTSMLSPAMAEPLRRNDHSLQQDDDAANLLLRPTIPLHVDFPGLGPAYVLDPAAAILRRAGGGCASNYHSCLDINSSLCCPNTKYCLINPTSLEPGCCDIGSVCGSPCSASQYECNATTTITLRSSTAASTSDSSAVATAVATGTTTSVYTACCARRCPQTSMFACASSLGNGCCSYGQTCASSSQCIWTTSASTSGSSTSTSSVSLTSAAPTSSCGTSQITCPTSLGTGCCALGYTCTVVTSQLFCAQQTAVVVTKNSSGGLSSGAKAGIAVGVVIGAAAIIGAATWACLHKRNRQQSTAGSRSQNPSEYDPFQMAHSDGQPGEGGAYLVGGHPRSPAHGPQMAESPVRSWRRPMRLCRNTASGSNSSAPISGPPGGPTDATDPDSYHTPLHDPEGTDIFPHGAGAAHGVPITPQAPHDIVAPVEIDSTAVARTESAGGGATAAPGLPLDLNNEKGHLERLAYTSVPQEPAHLPLYRPAESSSHGTGERFELDGSEVPPASSSAHARDSFQQPAPGASTSSGTAASPIDESPVLPRVSPPGLPGP